MKKSVSLLVVVLIVNILHWSMAFADSAIDSVANLNFKSIPDVTIDTVLKKCGLFDSVSWNSDEDESTVVVSCVRKDEALSSGLQGLCIKSGGNKVVQEYVFKITQESTNIIDFRYVILKNNFPVRIYSTIDGTIDTTYLDISLDEIFDFYGYAINYEETKKMNEDSIKRQQKQLDDARAKNDIERKIREDERKKEDEKVRNQGQEYNKKIAEEEKKRVEEINKKKAKKEAELMNDELKIKQSIAGKYTSYDGKKKSGNLLINITGEDKISISGYAKHSGRKCELPEKIATLREYNKYRHTISAIYSEEGCVLNLTFGKYSDAAAKVQNATHYVMINVDGNCSNYCENSGSFGGRFNK
ncbi:hypothetical protein [Desulfobacter postgatei]|uniref:hypothetical protein n=1 Tax=Desulfobacter postgatei TaxID=2293 RepID=UPI00259BA55A|nr:hypothetical protein [uncultured Desulfobacter sp.]